MRRIVFHTALVLAFWAVLAPPRAARADYLYSALPDDLRPRIYLIVDTSGSMNDDDDLDGLDLEPELCKYGADAPRGAGNRCYTRLDAAKLVLDNLLANRLDGIELGLIRFTTDPSQVMMVDPGDGIAEPRTCGACPIADATTNFGMLRTQIDSFQGNTWTPLAHSLDLAKDRIDQVRAGKVDLDGDGTVDPDPAANCRPYYAIILTDGDETCQGDPVASIKALLGDKVPTFVIGFGPDVAKSTQLTAMAQMGSTAVDDSGDLVCFGSNAPCASGTAMFADNTTALYNALDQVVRIILSGEFSVSQQILTTIPFDASEVDRVANNAIIEGSFRKNDQDYEGHLYGIQLYYELKGPSGELTGKFQYADFENPDQDGDGSYFDPTNCGLPGNACVYDAGQILSDRVHNSAYPSSTAAPQDGGERVIYTSYSSDQIHDGSSLTMTMKSMVAIPFKSASSVLAPLWSSYSSIPEFNKILAGSTGLPVGLTVNAGTLQPYPDALDQLGRWLHGDPALRSFPLGDIYHSSAAVVGAPPYAYRSYEYPVFKQALRFRPQMIYVGANDGLIHAFHAGPDITYAMEGASAPRWQQGEEAWAYLPLNMLARAMMASNNGETRFFSQDLSCRVDDVLVNQSPPSDDPYKGWRTILDCGQGWGGSWYVGLDITNPSKPQALWEFTDVGDVFGMGKTWSVPGVGILNVGGTLEWAAVFGSGYNADMQNCEGFSRSTGVCASAKNDDIYRLMNVPFSGNFPFHGDGVVDDQATVFALSLADGKVIKKEFGFAGLQDVVADVPVLDTDSNGLMDSAYVAGFDGRLGRMHFEGTGPGDLDPKTPIVPATDIGACPDAVRVDNRPLVNKPAMNMDPGHIERVFAFIASGLNGGSYPDEIRHKSSTWAFTGYSFDDNGTRASCSPHLQRDGTDVDTLGNVCMGSSPETLQLEGSQRLIGAPLLSQVTDPADHSTRTWLTYATWIPPPDVCGQGTARTLCRDVTQFDSCGLCKLGDETICADSSSCCVGPDCGTGGVGGVGGVGGTSGDGGNGGTKPPAPPGTPAWVGQKSAGNQPVLQVPEMVVLSWREVF